MEGKIITPYNIDKVLGEISMEVTIIEYSNVHPIGGLIEFAGNSGCRTSNGGALYLNEVSQSWKNNILK